MGVGQAQSLGCPIIRLARQQNPGHTAGAFCLNPATGLESAVATYAFVRNWLLLVDSRQRRLVARIKACGMSKATGTDPRAANLISTDAVARDVIDDIVRVCSVPGE